MVECDLASSSLEQTVEGLYKASVSGVSSSNTGKLALLNINLCLTFKKLSSFYFPMKSFLSFIPRVAIVAGISLISSWIFSLPFVSHLVDTERRSTGARGINRHKKTTHVGLLGGNLCMVVHHNWKVSWKASLPKFPFPTCQPCA